MIITTTDQIEGKRIVEVKGLVQGNTVRARNVGRDIIANFRNIIGGEIVGYTNLMTEARNQASERMEAQAEELGANAIVGMRFVTSMVLAGASELLAYGTGGDRRGRGLAFAVVGDSVLEGGPAQQGALDAYRELPHALQGHDVPEALLLLLRQLFTLHDALERPHETFRLVEREPVEMPREHRGRRLADRAALALETNVADATRVVEAKRQDDLIAAERIEPLGLQIRVGEEPLVAGPPVVIQDDILVEVIEAFGHLHR